MKIKQREMVLHKSEYIDFGSVDNCSIKEVSQFFLDQENKYSDLSKGWQVKFEVEHYGYDGGVEYYWRIYRPETDKEYNARLKKEAAAKAKANAIKRAKKEKALKTALATEAEERELMSKLMAKYGII